MNRLLAPVRRHFRLPWLLLVLLTACMQETPVPAASATAADAPPRRDAAAAAADAPQATERVLVDLRRPAPETNPVDATTTRRVVAAVYGDGAPADVVVADSAQGAFTAPERTQTLYLLVRGGAGAGPDAPRPMLAVFEDGKLLTQFVPDVRYDAIAATVDSNGDGSDELLLRADGYQMGQAFASLHLLSLTGGKRDLRQRFDQAYLDSCENPVGERSVDALVLVETAQGLRADAYRAPCPSQGEAKPADFQPISR